MLQSDATPGLRVRYIADGGQLGRVARLGSNNTIYVLYDGDQLAKATRAEDLEITTDDATGELLEAPGPDPRPESAPVRHPVDHPKLEDKLEPFKQPRPPATHQGADEPAPTGNEKPVLNTEGQPPADDKQQVEGAPPPPAPGQRPNL